MSLGTILIRRINVVARRKVELDTLRDKDIYSLVMFALFKLRDIPEYSSLSELAYVLDRENMLKLCEYFGGLTIRIPTIDELESILYSLVLYQKVKIEGMEYQDAVQLLGKNSSDFRRIKSDYLKICDILDNYEFTKR